ncbi:hypothetical protein [Lentibacillus saliphilus]|uniref:hypothetical protein n=1 Tax=Lentibacillus saliphilus TaxID=2737028 RepID=UPI001C2F3BD3|nr:hypothetical protein [Lentibacillus saliphilus]
MNQPASLHKAYTFIRRQRMRKKIKLYKMALGVFIDKTIATYLLLIGGYTFVSVFILGDFQETFHDTFVFVEQFGQERFWLILTILPIRYVNQAFTKPGVIFSSSEFQLAMLPYKRLKIWLYSAVVKWLSQLVILSVVGAFIIWLTTLPAMLVLAYIGLIMLYNIIMTIPQWKLYQKHLIIKIGAVILVGIVNMIGVLTQPVLVGVLLLSVILVLNIIWGRKLLADVDWKKVTEAGDFAIWSMLLVNRASGITMKQDRLYSIFEKIKLFKEPFLYGGRAIYRRLWILYLGKNYQLLLQLLGAVIALMFVALYLGDVYFHIGVAISIYVYTQSAVAFFTRRFHVDIVQILPWALNDYKDAFKEWMLYISIPLFIPISAYAVSNWSFWIPLIFLLYGSVFLLSLEIVLAKTVSLVAKERVNHFGNEMLLLVALICLAVIGYVPVVTFSFVVFLWVYFKKRKQPKFA